MYRIIDANFNRVKEGLRVCEDVCRFYCDDKANTRKFKQIRHSITDIVDDFQLKKLVKNRNIEKDVGKASTSMELKRRNIHDVFFANIQRSKESIRVLEEMAKLHNKKSADLLKKHRYAIYGLEKKVLAKI